jgi:hypothetical protein
MALAYMGRKWGDRDINQSFFQKGDNITPVLEEMRPGALEETFKNQKGYLYHLDPAAFTQNEKLFRHEVFSPNAVTPLSVEEKTDILEALQQEGVVLKKFDPTAESHKGVIQRTLKKMERMEPKLREGYLAWVREGNPYFADQLEKTAEFPVGLGIPPTATSEEMKERYDSEEEDHLNRNQYTHKDYNNDDVGYSQTNKSPMMVDRSTDHPAGPTSTPIMEKTLKIGDWLLGRAAKVASLLNGGEVAAKQLAKGVYEFAGPRAEEVLERIALRQPGPKSITQLLAKSKGISFREAEDQAVYETLKRNMIGGTINRGNVYLNADMPWGQGKIPSKEGVIAHELFHAQHPILGKSEVLAHFIGGLYNDPGRLNIPKAFEQAFIHLPMTRWPRALMEFGGLGVAGALAYKGIDHFTKDDESNPLQDIVRKRIGYDK